jgi:multidrug transporter EmrE-like cation transporter
MIYKVLLFAGVILNVLAQFMLKVGMKQVGLIEINKNILLNLKPVLLSPYVWGGIIFYGVSFLVYSVVLSKLELSKAFPVSSVGAIILVVLVSIIFLDESITLTKIVGLSLLILGIIIVFK